MEEREALFGNKRNYYMRSEGNCSTKGSNTAEEEKADLEDEVQNDTEICPNCKNTFRKKQMIKHTIICYRTSTKCKVCGEVLSQELKKTHLKYWRDPKVTFTFSLSLLMH